MTAVPTIQKTILLFGAGKSATILIRKILEHSIENNRKLIVIDANLELAISKTQRHPNSQAISFDIHHETERHKWIALSDIVISMLPPALHSLVALDCIRFKKNLLTASYLDETIKQYANTIQQKGLLFLYEMGLDPGIDHMSAMHLINKIKEDEDIIHSFKSHCGGLVALESDNNPWHYKISWNPTNVVYAGKSGAEYKSNHEHIHIDYTEIFKDCPTVEVPGIGRLSCYPNRDSLSYMPLYGLEDTSNFIRTTLRYPAFCIGWNAIIMAGLTDSNPNSIHQKFQGQPLSAWLNACLNFYTKTEHFDAFLKKMVIPNHQNIVSTLFNFLGLTSNEPVPRDKNSGAEIIQYLLETRLALLPEDKDMIVMLHEIEYQKGMQSKFIKSHLIVNGDDSLATAMAKTVGLPLFIACELILNGQISLVGLRVPVVKEIYEPVLYLLEKQGIKFTEI